jgi:hypothetical protein
MDQRGIRKGVKQSHASILAREGTLTSRLSSVKRTATPASTLPTVKETNILGGENRILTVRDGA